MFLLPLIKPLLKSKLGLAVVGISAVAYFSGFNPLSSIMGGGSKPVNEAADNENPAQDLKTQYEPGTADNLSLCPKSRADEPEPNDHSH